MLSAVIHACECKGYIHLVADMVMDWCVSTLAIVTIVCWRLRRRDLQLSSISTEQLLDLSI